VGLLDLGRFGGKGLGVGAGERGATGLLDGFDPEKTRLTGWFSGCETIFIFGGLAETVRCYGVEMTSEGREKEAAISRIVAAGTGAHDTKRVTRVAKWNSGTD